MKLLLAGICVAFLKCVGLAALASGVIYVSDGSISRDALSGVFETAFLAFIWRSADHYHAWRLLNDDAEVAS